MDALEAVGDHVGNAAGLQDAAVSAARAGDEEDQTDLVSARGHDFRNGTVQVGTGDERAVEYADGHCHVLVAQERKDFQYRAVLGQHGAESPRVPGR